MAARAGARAGSSSASEPLFHVSFRVFGKVQGVFFRKHTALKAESLKVAGWVMNSPDGGSVLGEAEGSRNALDRFRHWLAEEGSPKSVIERAEFSDEYEVAGSSPGHGIGPGKFGGVFTVRK